MFCPLYQTPLCINLFIYFFLFFLPFLYIYSFIYLFILIRHYTGAILYLRPLTEKIAEDFLLFKLLSRDFQKKIQIHANATKNLTYTILK